MAAAFTWIYRIRELHESDLTRAAVQNDLDEAKGLGSTAPTFVIMGNCSAAH